MKTAREAKWCARMTALNVAPEEIEEIFTRSSGPGGQNVNKSSSAVVLIHRPTGLHVRCEQERSQTQNRIRARELLLDKLEHRRRSLLEAERARREKTRRQTRKRSRSAQERILQDKAHRSARKRQRQLREAD